MGNRLFHFWITHASKPIMRQAGFITVYRLSCIMLRLNKIVLTHFKNYPAASFEFPQRVTGICGLNGRGKTNLLDAIYYCCFTKSYFSNSEQLNVCFGKEGFRMEAWFTNAAQPLKVVCISRGNGKKEILLNDIAYEKLSQHIGLLPAVIVAPDDIEVITGGSEERRKLIDTILCQLDATYLQQLMLYNKVLLQRNSLLKQMAEKGKDDEALLQILDAQLIAPGNYVFAARKKFTDKLIPLVQQFYQQLTSRASRMVVIGNGLAAASRSTPYSLIYCSYRTPFLTILSRLTAIQVRRNLLVSIRSLPRFLMQRPRTFLLAWRLTCEMCYLLIKPMG